MLGSFGNSSSHDQEEDQQASPSELIHYDHHHRQIQPPPPLAPRGFPSPAIHMRHLLISCAELISESNFSAAHRLVSVLSANSSPYGDSTERLVHLFTKALSLRLSRSWTSIAKEWEDETVVQSSYLSLNQVTPFLRFTHLTANQAILEAVQGHQAVHILDFDIMHGVQWPPLMQAMAERYPPPTLRITGTGHDLHILRRTGDRLSKFAQSLGLTFEFHPLHLQHNQRHSVSSSLLLLLPDETLAVNCVLYLHRLHRDDDADADPDRDRVCHFLHALRSMNPIVLTLGEREASHRNPLFLERFVEAVDHYTAVLDSLEATLPPKSRERLRVEQVWLGREIADIVAAEGDSRRERHQRFRSWEALLRSSGFNNLPLSPFALSQAKLLLRLHYPSEGYQLHILNNSFFLGWQNQPLFSVSSWN